MLAFCLRCAELFWLALALITLQNATLVVRRRKVFHTNLMWICAYMSIGLLIILLTQLIICCASFFDPRINVDPHIFLQKTKFRVVAKMRLAACFFTSGLALVIAIERCIATLYLPTYEQQRARIPKLFAIKCVCWLYGFILAVLSYNNSQTIRVFSMGTVLVVNLTSPIVNRL